ncbi:S-adenosyl-L-methionine-dependent methyltransferase [Xylariomycetidae sp. FL2044]|nr:S-adenosyl-L-methionine-dependent methyltransferase [Xylariomycetidae sp. FL2044]
MDATQPPSPPPPLPLLLPPADENETATAFRNRSFFDDEAARYDNKHRKMNERLAREIQERLDWIGVDWVYSDDDDDDDDDDEDGDDGDEDEDGEDPVAGDVRGGADADGIGDGDGDGDADDEGKRMKGKGKDSEREVRLLDYACGTGMMTRTLAPWTTQCVGIDISANMVAVYNARARNQGIPPSEMHAVVGDLAVANDPHPAHLSGPEFSGFDIAVVGGGFHHFDDPELAAVRLVERLRVGGVLLIWDFLPHSHSHDHHHHGDSGKEESGEKAEEKGEGEGEGEGGRAGVRTTVQHHGFTAERIQRIFEAAGAGRGFGIEVLGSGVVLGGEWEDEGHGHGHGHDHEGSEEEGKGKGKGKGKEGHGGHDHDHSSSSKRRRIFLARGEKEKEM